MSMSEILDTVSSFGAHYVCVTGGEPLVQPGAIPLCKALCDAGYEVSLETSGSIDISNVDPRVVKVMDLKTPGSLELDKNLFSNINHLTKNDQVKFVICDRGDYEWSRDQLKIHSLAEKVSDVLFSPSFEQIEARQLAEWVLEDRLPVRFQLQQHKLLWADAPGH